MEVCPTPYHAYMDSGLNSHVSEVGRVIYYWGVKRGLGGR